ncbi:uncharacterized protein JCM10292_006697 [Rhodotorula paludigena]|uniref:uncharacterized protein n=1 Tax=Rhodotorula paludigena TaxID=86838 RepID=UPI0031713AF4
MSTISTTRPPQPRRKTLLGSHPVCTKSSMEDSYEAGDVIGTGSFGIIRKVVRRVDGQVLARKELNYGRMDERDLKQLTEEVNILEQLGANDNIVRYYERFVDKPNNMLYILMEYCPGGDLAGVIQRCRKTGQILSEEVVWAYLAQITLALGDCHSETDAKGQRKRVILHRDIKPENVFLDELNNLKLGDFGLSKAMEQAAMTQTYVGTPYYMSPELINGQPYDVKSDIWALGCLIYELCAGHPPFHEARTQPELAVMIREGKIPDLPKPYSVRLGQVVKAMLRQNPKSRPNTAQLKALDEVKMQIRAGELRKWHRELRLRDQHVTQREKDLLAREAAVLSREQSVHLRETAVHSAQEATKEAEAKLAQAWAVHRAQVYQAQQAERENVRPPVQGVEPEVVARVASRPSMVPRPPLNERRSSGIGGLPFPRVSSSSSLMSLDDTPTKDHSPSLRRRLASKSMHNLQGAASLSTPSRAHSASNDNLRGTAASQARRSPSLITIPISHPLPTSVSVVDLPYMARTGSAGSSAGGVSPTLSIHSAPPVPGPSSPHARAYSSPAATSCPPVYTYDDDVPSPFLKKQPVNVVPGRLPPPVPSVATGSAPRAAKPPILTRLLASRAAAAAGLGPHSHGAGGGGEGNGVPVRRASLAPRKSVGV